MNGSNLIFPLIGTGQAASLQTGQTLEGENTAFAENLTAALATLSVTTVMPNQQASATPITSLQDGLVDGSLEAATPTTGEPVGTEGAQGAGIFRSIADADIRSAGNVDTEASAGSAESKAASDASPPAHGLRTADFVNAAKAPISLADVDGASADIESLGLEPLAATKTDMRQPGPISVNAVAGRPSGNAAVDHQAADDGDRPVAVSPVSSLDRQPVIVSDGHETARIDGPHQLATHSLGGNASSTDDSLKTIPPSKAPLADAPLSGETRLAGQTVPASVLAQGDQPGPMPSPSSPSGLQTATQRVAVSSEGPQPLQPVMEQAVRPDAVTSLQREASGQLAGRVEGTSPMLRRSVGAQKNEVSDPAMRPLALNGDRSGPTEDQPKAGKAHTPSTLINEAHSKSGPGAQSGGAAQTTIVEGTFRPPTEFSGFDRLQSTLSAESPVLDTARFEAASSLGQVKAQTPAAQASAGAQIALQIVRSLPGGIDRFSVHLHPAELGSVDIQLNFEGGGRLSALITAERPETLELLQRDSRLLERSLGDSGLKLASDGLSFALKQDHQQQQHGQGFHEQAQARHAAFRAGRAYDDTPDIEQAPSAMRVDGLRLLDIET